MKKFILYALAILLFIGLMQECFNSCSGDDEKNESEPETIDEAIKANDFQACNEMLTYVYDRYVDSPRSYEIADRYIPRAIKVLKAEGSYLIDVDDTDAEKLFLLCLNDVIFKIGGFTPKEKQTESSDYDNDQYKECTTPLNACLLALIRESLIKDNLSFAEKIVPYIQIGINKSVKNEHFTGGDYTYKFDYTEQKTAKKLISDYKAKNNIR